MNKMGGGLLLGGLVIVAIFFLGRPPFPQYTAPSPSITPLSPSNKPTISVITVDPNDPPKEMTLEGEYVCLPHTNTNGPQTLECALGLKLGDDTYIALDMGNSLKNMNFATGSMVHVTGLYVPVEQLSTTMWQKYPITGIMRVNSAKKL